MVTECIGTMVCIGIGGVLGFLRQRCCRSAWRSRRRVSREGFYGGVQIEHHEVHYHAGGTVGMGCL